MLFYIEDAKISFLTGPLEKTIIQDLERQVKRRKYLPAPKNIFMFPDILTTSAVTVVYVQNSALFLSALGGMMVGTESKRDLVQKCPALAGLAAKRWLSLSFFS